MAKNKRRYVTISDIEAFSDITVTDVNEAYQYIDMAEEMVDQYVGTQNKFLPYEIKGIATGGTTTTLIDTNTNDGNLQDTYDNYYTYCQLEIIGGTNAGEVRQVTGYDASARSLTVDEAFTSAIDTTSVYRLYQLGKFPRLQDVEEVNNIYYKWIPEQVKRAVVAQFDYILNKGRLAFTDGSGEKQSETIGDYSYTNFGNSTTASAYSNSLSTQAKLLLKGILNRKARMIIRKTTLK